MSYDDDDDDVVVTLAIAAGSMHSIHIVKTEENDTCSTQGRKHMATQRLAVLRDAKRRCLQADRDWCDDTS